MADSLELLHRLWRAANDLAVGMIYLQDNPLLREPLRPEHIKNRLLGHWGSSPGQAFLWAHANLLVRGYEERGNITTPLELAMNNQIDRFNLVIDMINRAPGLGSRAAPVNEQMREAILAHRSYAHEHGMDAPDISHWRWEVQP